MANSKLSWVRQVWAIARKDFQAEWRTRIVLVTTLAFAIIALTVVSLTVGALKGQPNLAAGLLWVILFFAAIVALGRTFTKEEDAHTANLLRLTATPTAVFAGKFLFNFLLLALLSVVTMPLFIGLMGIAEVRIGLLIGTAFLTVFAMAAMGTVLGAMLVKAQTFSSLLAVAAFPLFFPAIAAAVQATVSALGANPIGGAEQLRFLFAYAFAAFLGGLLLFDEVW